MPEAALLRTVIRGFFCIFRDAGELIVLLVMVEKLYLSPGL